MCDYFAQQRIMEGSSTPAEEGCTCYKKSEEFNLSEKRNELFTRLKDSQISIKVGLLNLVDLFLEIEKQDKEFIKRLKELHKKKLGSCKCDDCTEFHKKVDKLAGPELI